MHANLHTHTKYSDGADKPSEILRLAADNGVRVVSITDHDTVAAYGDINPGENSGVRVIPGAEISVTGRGRLLHILGYYIDTTNRALAKYIEKSSAERTASTMLNFNRAAELFNFDYKWERVVAHNPNQPRITGIHIIQSMKADGYTIPGIGLWELFAQHLASESDNYVTLETATVYDAVDAITAAGGLPVVAHPISIKDDDLVRKLIDYGVTGLEVYHPSHTAADIKRYLEMAESRELYITGGSDWHGENVGHHETPFGGCGLADDSYKILRYGK